MGATALLAGVLVWLPLVRGATQGDALLLLFHLPLAALVSYASIRYADDFHFEGATVGASFSPALVGPPLFGGFALLAVVWVVRDLRSGRTARTAPWVWTPSARIRAVLVLALFGVEAVLFRSSGIQSTANQVGVGLVFWQWFMINRALASSRALATGQNGQDNPTNVPGAPLPPPSPAT